MAQHAGPPQPLYRCLQSAHAALPLRSTLEHDGRHTDIRIWPARSAVKAVVLFICGNPGLSATNPGPMDELRSLSVPIISGLIDYYTEFLSTIHALNIDESQEIIGLGHEGHSTDRPLSYLEALNRPDAFRKTRPLPTLREQIDRKIDLVDKLVAKYTSDVKLVLIGHSVGAYICEKSLWSACRRHDADLAGLQARRL